MNFFDIFLPLAAVFTVLNVWLLFFILGLHWRENRRVRREANFRQAAAPVVESYLTGSTRLEEVVAALKKKPTATLHLLIERSEALKPGEIERMQALVRAFPFVRKMIAALKSPNRYTRLENAHLLGYLRDESAIPSLLKALEDEALDVRLAAARSLARLGCSDAVKPILRALDVPGEMPERRVVEVLVQFGSCAIDPLLDFLNDPQSSDRGLAIAVRACGMLRSTRAVPRLVEDLEHKAPEVRFNSVRALAAIGDPAAIVPISRLAKDPAWKVRNKVMRSLGILHPADQIPLLVQGLSDPVWEVRFSAAEGLYQMGQAGKDELKNAVSGHLDPLARNVSQQILEEHGDLPPTARVLS